mgnify:CR=1 FL=1
MAKKKESGFSAELKSAIEALNKSYGEGTIIGIEDAPNTVNEYISTGSYLLDEALGGGYVKGKIFEIFGEESIGKSTLALHFMTQFKGKPILYIDTEQSLDKDYAKRLGVDLPNMIITQPDTIEQAITIMLDLCDKVDAIVFDSVAEAATSKELEGEISDQDIGVKAKLMSKAIRKLKGKNHDSTIIFINQTRENPGITYGSNRVTPAGRALKFGSHARIDLYGKELIKKGEDPIGHYMNIKIVKNKSGKPHIKVQVPLIFDGYGINKEQEIIDLAIEKGVLTKSGSWIKHGDTNIAQGIENTRTFLFDNPEFKEELLKEIKAI